MMLNLLTQSANDGKMMTVTMMSDILKVSKAAISQSIKALNKKTGLKVYQIQPISVRVI